MRYRPDVDGLRALAIAAVVLFHAGFSAVPGGFIGVDVFFVISGFLITGLIIDRLRQGDFSFWEFYARRTRRIFPALFSLLLVVLVAGYLVLTPSEYAALGKSAVYSSAFLANVYFWLHTGYFDQAADTMPLLHLWSIGVEEQFYVIWPLSVVLVWRYLKLGRIAALSALIGTTALLALLCVVWTAYDAKSAFYLPFTRLWEFTLGALLLAIPPIRQPRLADGLSVLGVLAMGYAALSFTADLNYPGYYAVLPSLGAAAVMAAGERSLVGRVLSLGPNVLLGKMSYSLYLWHWPIIVFYGYYAGVEDLSTSEKLSLILAASVIAFISWRFIELPVRRQRGHPRLHIAYGAMVAGTVGCLALVVAASAGLSWRLPKDLRSLASHDEMTGSRCSQRIPIPELHQDRVCIVGAPWGSGTNLAVLWGDSHAAHLAPLVDRPAKRQGLSVIVWKGCAPFIDDRTLWRKKRAFGADYSSKCGKSRKTILSYVRDNPNVKLVIISNAWPSYLGSVYDADSPLQEMDSQRALSSMAKGFATTIAEIEPLHHSVLLMGDVPRPRFQVPNCRMQVELKLWRKPCTQDMNFLDRDAVFTFHRPTESILAHLASDKDHIYYLNVQKSMCGPKGCPLTINGELIYADESHLRRDLSLNTRESLASLLDLDEVLRLVIDRAPSAAHAEAR
jgi:peptidoglycan/LPS O-acetylase OafA/YrhL